MGHALHSYSSATVQGSGGDTDYGRALALDSDGNIFLTGSLNETSGGGNIWLGKFSPSLSLTGNTSVNGSGNSDDSGNGVIVSTDGSIFVIGSVNQSSSADDIWLGKYNSSLNLVSSITINGSSNSTDIGYAIAKDTSGYIYATGYITETSGGANIWIGKFNDSLTLLSSAVIAGSAGGTDYGHAIAVEGSSNVYVTGYIFETSGSENFWVAKLNTSLQLQLSASMTGSAAGADSGQDIAIDQNGKIFVIGSLNETVGNINIWIARLNSSFSIERSTNVLGSASATDIGYALALDQTGNPYVAGYLYGLSGDQDIWTGFYSPNLLPQTTATINGSANAADFAYDVAVDSNLYVYVTGFAHESAGGRNIVLTKHNLLNISSNNINTTTLGASSVTWAWNADHLHTDGFRVISSSQGNLSGNLTSSSWTETALTANTLYRRQIVAYNSWAASTSTVVSTYTLAAPPTGLMITETLITSMTLTWGANTNPEGTSFRLNYWKINGSTSSLTTTATTATATGLSSGSTYYFSVLALNGLNVPTYSTSPPVYTVTIDSSAPVAPSLLSAFSHGTSSISWSWSGISRETSLQIFHSSGGAASELLAAGTSSWIEINLSTNTLYSRQIVAYNAWSASTSTIISTYTLAAPPTGFSVSNIFTSSIALTWSSNTNPADTRYQLDYWKILGSTSSATAALTTTTLTGLDPGTSIYITLSALNGSTAPATTNLNTILAFTASSGPVNFNAMALGSSSMSWTWADAEGEDRYVIMASSGGSISPNLPQGTTSWIETGLSTNSAYSRRVLSFKGDYQNASRDISRFTLASPPAEFAFTSVKSSQTALSWSANNNPEGTLYQILRWVPGGSTTTLTSTTTSLTISGLNPSSTYFFDLYSVNNDTRATRSTSLTLSTVTAPSSIARSIGSGLWSDSGIWLNAIVPSEGYAVTIAEGHIVMLDKNAAIASMNIEGSLRWPSLGSSTTLAFQGGNLNIRAGGILQIAEASLPLAAGTTAAIILSSGSYPGEFGLNIDDGGSLLIWGSTKSVYSAALSNISPLDTSLTINISSAQGWLPGDSIVISQSERSSPNQSEQRIIGSISGSTIEVNQPFDYAHYATNTIIVANLTRSAVIRSSATQTNYLRSLATSATNFILNHAEINNLGSGSIPAVRIESRNNRPAAGSIEYCSINAGAGGISLSSAVSMAINSNVIDAQQGSGLKLIFSSSSTILSNIVLRNQSHGIWLSSSSTMNTLRFNRAISNLNCGLSLTQSSSNTIENNFFNSNGDCGFQTSTDTVNNSFSSNTVLNNSGSGSKVFGSWHFLSGNQSIGNGGLGLEITGQYFILANNQTTNNRSHGLSLNGGSNIISDNIFRSNGASGWRAFNGNNLFINNISSVNAAYGQEISSASGSRFFNNQYSQNSGGGTFIDSSNDLFLVREIVYGNDSNGLSVLNSTITASDLILGYDSSGNSRADANSEIIYLGRGQTILRNSRINPAAGISTDSFSSDERSLISFKHNQIPGRVEIWGDYQVNNSTLTLDYSNALYNSTATPAQTTPRQQASPASMIIGSTIDNNAQSEHIKTIYDSMTQQWFVVSSSSGTLGSFTGSLNNQAFPSSTIARFYATLTAHGPAAHQDRIDFLALSSSLDASQQKRLILNRTSAQFNGGKSRLTINPGSGLIAQGTEIAYASIEAAPGADSFTLISSGALTLHYSSVTKTDSLGIQIGGALASVSMSTVTFDYLAIAPTATYITVGDLSSTAVFSFIRFDSSQSTVSISNAYNVKIIGTNASVNWFFGASTGPLSGSNYAFDPSGSIIWNSIASIPTLSAAETAISSITWNWSPVIGASGYRIVSSSGSNLSGDLSISLSSWTETNLTTNTAYSRRLVAFNFLDRSTSPVVSLYTLAAPPQNVQITQIHVSSASLQWQANSNADLTPYVLSYWPIAGATTTATVNVTSASLTGLSEGTSYNVLVAAQNGDGRLSNAANGTVSFILYLEIPSSLSALALGASSISWRWSDISGENYYQIASSTGGILSNNLSPGTTQWIETGLSTNTLYTRRVLAVNTHQVSTTSYLSVYTLTATPGNLNASYIGISSMTLSWDNNGNPDGTITRILTWQTSQSTSVVLSSLSTHSFTSLNPSTTYFFIAAGINGDGALSSYSSIFSTFTQSAIKNSLIENNAEQTIVSPLGLIRLIIPAGTFPNGTSITINEYIPQSDITLPNSNNVELSTSSVAEITATFNNERISPVKTISIEMLYDLSDFSSSTKAGELFAGRLGSSDQDWVALETSRGLTEQKLTGLTNHFSHFGILWRSPARNINSIKIYPNPFTPSLGHQKIQIDNIPANSSISIYTIGGILTRRLTDDDGDGRISWDVTNEAGANLASGIYLGYIESLGQNTILKIAVER